MQGRAQGFIIQERTQLVYNRVPSPEQLHKGREVSWISHSLAILIEVDLGEGELNQHNTMPLRWPPTADAGRSLCSRKIGTGATIPWSHPMIPVSRQGLTSRNLWSRAPKGQKIFSEDYCHSTSSTVGSWLMQNPKSSWTYLQEGNSPFRSQPGFDNEYQVSLLFSNEAINKGSLIINWSGILCLPYILCLVFYRQISNDRSKGINNSKKID